MSHLIELLALLYHLLSATSYPHMKDRYSLNRTHKIIILLLMALALVVRIIFQQDRPFTGDSLGTLLYIKYDYSYILTHFSTWLSMNVFICIEKFLADLFGPNPWILVMPSMFSGITLVPVTAMLARRFCSPRTAIIAAALVAVNPYLIFYSVQLRSYALWTLCLLLSLIFLYDWWHRPAWWTGIGCTLFVGIAALLHANTIYFAPLWVFVCIGWLLTHMRRHSSYSIIKHDALTILLPGVLMFFVVLIAYLPLIASMRETHSIWLDTSPTPINYLSWIICDYFGDGYYVLPSLCLLILGVWVSICDKQHILILSGMLLIPTGMASLAGLSHYPWAYARFLIPVLPILLIFIAEGIYRISQITHNPIYSSILIILIALSWWPAFAHYQSEKECYPWNVVIEKFKQLPGHKTILPVEYGRQHVGLQLMPYLYEMNAGLMNAESLPHHEPLHRLFVICADNPITTEYPTKRIGDIQVVIYDGESNTNIAEAVLADLIASTGDTVNPLLTGQYKMIRELYEALGQSIKKNQYDAFYYQCLMRTKRQRFQPPQLSIKQD